jgi:hypothetical protein
MMSEDWHENSSKIEAKNYELRAKSREKRVTINELIREVNYDKEFMDSSFGNAGPSIKY